MEILGIFNQRIETSITQTYILPISTDIVSNCRVLEKNIKFLKVLTCFFNVI